MKFLSSPPDREQVLNNLNLLDLSTSEIAHRMRMWGDYRSSSTIQRSIQRMRNGEIAISGEFCVVIKLLLARQEQFAARYKRINWIRNDDVTAKIDEFDVTLKPYKNGRWVVIVRHRDTGYCAPWPTFPKSLDEAKRKAIVIIEDTRGFLIDND